MCPTGLFRLLRNKLCKRVNSARAAQLGMVEPR